MAIPNRFYRVVALPSATVAIISHNFTTESVFSSFCGVMMKQLGLQHRMREMFRIFNSCR